MKPEQYRGRWRQSVHSTSHGPEARRGAQVIPKDCTRLVRNCGSHWGQIKGAKVSLCFPLPLVQHACIIFSDFHSYRHMLPLPTYLNWAANVVLHKLSLQSSTWNVFPTGNGEHLEKPRHLKLPRTLVLPGALRTTSRCYCTPLTQHATKLANKPRTIQT